jgi:hypothetical protein
LILFVAQKKKRIGGFARSMADTRLKEEEEDAAIVRASIFATSGC